MNLENVFLKKEELPILYESCFEIPIHPKLLDPKVKLDPSIAKIVFPLVAEEWREDLIKYAENEKDKSKRDWYKEVFINESQEIKKEYSRQLFLGSWEDNILKLENGFVSSFSISRNGGGSLYFNETDMNCEGFSPGVYNKFSLEKAKEFSFKEGKDSFKIFKYASHNIDHYPGALFLRNWAIRYMNEVFRDIF